MEKENAERGDVMPGFQKRPKQTQCERFYRLFRQNWPNPVSLPTLHATGIADRNTRIWDLRHRYGLRIECEEPQTDRTEYWLVTDSKLAADRFGFPDVLPENEKYHALYDRPIVRHEPIPPPCFDSGSLFGPLTPEPRYPD